MNNKMPDELLIFRDGHIIGLKKTDHMEGEPADRYVHIDLFNGLLEDNKRLNDQVIDYQLAQSIPAPIDAEVIEVFEVIVDFYARNVGIDETQEKPIETIRAALKKGG